MKRSRTIFGLILLIFFSCGEKKANDTQNDSNSKKLDDSVKTDQSEPQISANWIDIQEKISNMTGDTDYEEVIAALGNPYMEHATSDKEYILLYNVPGVKGAIFWVMLDSKTKKFLYWSGEKSEKILAGSN